MSAKETWKPLREHPNYEVSDAGRVRSIDHYDALGRLHSGRVLAPQPNGPYNYQKVALGRSSLNNYIHRLVAGTFITSVEGFDVDHIDGDVTNNQVGNLRVVTHAENMVLTRDRTPNCLRGHPYAEHGVMYSGKRDCKACQRSRDRGRVRAKHKSNPTNREASDADSRH